MGAHILGFRHRISGATTARPATVHPDPLGTLATRTLETLAESTPPATPLPTPSSTPMIYI
jgi:hypothetical protein